MRLRPMFWLVLFLVLFVLPHLWAAAVVYGGSVEHWSRARWDSAGLAPDPATTPEPVVQVYAARAWGWKGVFAVHSWIVIKRAGRARLSCATRWSAGASAAARRRCAGTCGRSTAAGPAIRRRSCSTGAGREVEALIDRIEAAIAAYPYPDRYSSWPGPNSNTFIAHIGARGARARPRAAADRDRQGLSQQRQPVRAHAERHRLSAVAARPARPVGRPARRAWRSTCSA